MKKTMVNKRRRRGRKRRWNRRRRRRRKGRTNLCSFEAHIMHPCWDIMVSSFCLLEFWSFATPVTILYNINFHVANPYLNIGVKLCLLRLEQTYQMSKYFWAKYIWGEKKIVQAKAIYIKSKKGVFPKQLVNNLCPVTNKVCMTGFI